MNAARDLFRREPGVLAMAALAAAAWLLIALARTGSFGYWPLALPLLAVAAWLGGTAWLRSTRLDKGATVGLVILAALLYLPPAQTLALTGDAAIYAGNGAFIARTGGMSGPFAPLALLSTESRDLFYISSDEQFDGVIAATAYDGLLYGSYYMVDDGAATGAPPMLRSARMPQVESWLALLYKTGSLRAPFFLSPLFAALALCMLYAVGRRLYSPWIALWVATLLGISYPQVYLSRAPLAEIVGQFWTLAALLLALRWLTEKRPWQLAATLLLWTTVWSARIDSILLMGPAALLLMWAAVQQDGRSLRAALFSAPFVIGLGTLGNNPVYVGATAELSVQFIDLLGPAAVAAGAGLPLLAGVAWLWGPRLWHDVWPHVRRPLSLLILVTAAFLVFWSTIPNPWRDPFITRHFQEIPWFSSAYVTPLFYWLALAGMGVLLLRGFDAPQGFLLLTTLGLGAAYFYTYTSANLYPISLRRLIGDVLPLLALMAGYAFSALAVLPAPPAVRRTLRIAVAAVALGWMGALMRPLLSQYEARDEVADVAALHAQLPPDGVFLFEPQDDDSWIGWLAAPLYSLYADWALLLESDTPAPETLATAIREFEAAGRAVYIVSQSSPAPAALTPPGYSATQVLSTTWSSALIGQTRAPYPPLYWEFALPLYVYRVEPARGQAVQQ